MKAGRSMLARVAALEGMRAAGAPLCVILASYEGPELRGYAWQGGQAVREPGEADSALLQRAEREAKREPWGGIVLRELR